MSFVFYKNKVGDYDHSFHRFINILTTMYCRFEKYVEAQEIKMKFHRFIIIKTNRGETHVSNTQALTYHSVQSAHTFTSVIG